MKGRQHSRGLPGERRQDRGGKGRCENRGENV